MPKPPAASSTAAALSPPERIFLFCVASGTAWEKAVTASTPQHLVIRGLVERDAHARYTLTDQGRAVMAALIGGRDR